MRDSVLNLGDQPCNFLFGRLGGPFGAVLVSGIFHDLNLERGGHSVISIGFWLMNGVGVVLERLWKRATGRMVDGTWGRTWALGWLLLWGVPMVDVYAKVWTRAVAGTRGACPQAV